jgi:hydroxymethylglutaryl-CoA reductase (NADPH)
MQGNIENPVGAAQVPLGVAGPLLVHGSGGSAEYYVPMATTEGALVRSYERGMVTLTRAGGVHARVYCDENRVSPVFTLAGVAEAHEFAAHVARCFPTIQREAESTTNHGKLLRVEPYPAGRRVILNFCFHTGDAHGMNMIVKATERACEWILQNSGARDYSIFSGMSSEKRASGFLLAGGKGKKVVAGASIPARTVQAWLHATPEDLVSMWHRTVLGHLQAGALGYNGHYANGLAAIFLACGQDVANIVNCAVGITDFDLDENGDLYASVTLPSLTVATVGGGTALGTAAECLQMMDSAGPAKAVQLAEIVAAALLAGELSMGAAIASGEFVAAHEHYGRNRPGSS